MSQPPICQTAEFFVLRSPGLPLQALFPAGGGLPEPLGPRLRELAGRPEVREALALASPDLSARLGPWLADQLEAAAAQSVERGLLKYLGRMSSRATPFGLFAAISTGTWGTGTRLEVAPWPACRKSLRLDWGVLETLVDRLEQAPEVRAGMTVRPNTSLYSQGGWLRYLERGEEPGGGGRAYRLEAVEATRHLELVLQQAQSGATLEALAADLAQRLAVTPAVAHTFLDQVLDAQVLCGDLAPPLTAPDALGWVLGVLRSRSVPPPQVAALARLAEALEVLRGTAPGTHPEGYSALAEPLAELGVSPDRRDTLQVDLLRPAPDLTLGPQVRRALEAGVETLRRLTPPAQEGPLDRFRVAFQARYDTRWLPLLEVLDEEGGIGFDGGSPLDSPLLDGLPFLSAAAPRPLTARDRVLLAQLPTWQGQVVWDLSDAAFEALANPEPPAFPASFAALVTLAADSDAEDQDGFQFWLEQYSGPTAARWLGRFAAGDPALESALREHLQKEETARPEVLFAELVHVPEGRMGNVLARPALRRYEIPFLATAGVPEDHTIPPTDLLVTVRGGRIHLASARLGREVVPRLSSAHNFARGPAVYRFLAHLQDQDGRPGGWSWGALADQPFLPRVVRGRHVLCKARWRIRASELGGGKGAGREAAWEVLQGLRAARGLPRFVVLTDADNTLLVDLEQPLWTEVLLQLVSGRTEFTLTECFPAPDQALVAAPEGLFAHELVVPFAAPVPARATVVPRPAQLPLTAPVFSPGSEWLYLKVYCGPAGADRLLVELEPLLRLTEAKALWDRWHFIRYGDPDHHLRLRFHGEPRRLLGELLPALHAFLDARRAQGQLWTWQVATFEPEVARYGGPLGFRLAEEWFTEDSHQVLQRLACGLPAEDRWQTGLVAVDGIWAALGLSLTARLGLARSTRDAFRQEFGDQGNGAVQMGHRFRTHRRELESALLLEPEPPGLGSLDRIREAADQGVLQGERSHLAGSLGHMHLNRLLRRDHRETEWVLMEFLARLYESRLARDRKSAEAPAKLAASAPRGAG